MSWYSENYRFRRALSVDATGKGASPIDATITLPTDDDLFWDTIQSTGYDIRVTDADGITLEVFERASYTYASRAATIEIDNMAIDVSKHNLVWLYFGYSSATDGSTGVVPSAAATAYIAQETPDPAYTILCGPERPGATIPQTKIQKLLSAYLFLYWDLTDALQYRDANYEGSPLYEEIQSYTFAVNLAQSGQAAMIDDTLCRVLEQNGRRYIRTLVKAGTGGSNYQAMLTVYTTLGRRLQYVALVQVYDVREPS